MNASNRDALGAVVARQRGRARLRAATLTLGAASLVTAGVVAYTLPGATHTAVSTSAAGTSATQGGSTGVHTVSGGSGVATTQTSARSGVSSATAPTSSTGSSHVTSGGS